MSDPVIEATKLTKSYGSTVVLDSLDVRVENGITGLLGSNGAGKTTLLGLVLGLHQPDSGTLKVLGSEPGRASADLRSSIGYSPEHHDLPADLQAADLVRHIGELHGLDRRTATERANSVLWQVGLGEERFRPIGTMSTGQRQRVKLAQALGHDPLLLLLDEPTDGLDPTQRDDMLRLIRRIGREFSINVVLSSHRLNEVEQVCDNVVILDDGKVIRQGSIASLRTGSEALSVSVDGGAAELRARLIADHLDVGHDAAGLIVRGDDAARLIRNHVADLGIGLRRLAPQRSSLEDVFLAGGDSVETSTAP